MEVTLYTFSKRINSMKDPVSTEVIGMTTQCRFKDNTSIETPILLINSHNEIEMMIVNYCLIEDIGRYYWVDDIISVSANLYELHCSLDVLATFKTFILQQKAYVLYSASQFNSLLVDTRIPFLSQNALRHDIEEGDGFFQEEPDANGSVVFITIGGKEEAGEFYGGYNYYVLTEAQWKSAMCKLSNSDSLWSDLKNYFGDAANSIICARRFPIDLSKMPINDVSYGRENIKAGKWEIDYTAYPLLATCIERTINFEVPSFKSDFTEWEPYTNYRLYAPFLGAIDLSPSDFGKDILVKYVIDLITGLMTVNICRGEHEENVVASYTTEIGEALPTVANQTSIGSAISSGIGATGWAAGAINAGSAVMGITALMMASSAVSSAMSSTSKQHGSFGGSRCEVAYNKFVLQVIRQNHNMTFSEIQEVYGRPLCRVKQLSELTGYCQTREFHMELNAQKNILEKIEEMMDGGVYIE